ncbi:DMT family transporter [Nocardioides iriomotensis]|uniref:EamA family transporter n=1 Tax=Nocardioides iriomotensis TaxID=715784 RepID=A0A4Q5J0B1_9ACTN|nr:DMT family transporter [Nocardioides iriomotensis]RYU11892.1 EamA family transporter [Nocardioides iriomotensis]
MTPAALALVLTAAVAHALWNLAAKRVVADRVVLVWLYVVGAAVLWVPPALVWAVVSGQRPNGGWLLVAGVSALLHVAYNLVLVHGYAAGDLNLVYPLARGVGPLVVLVVAVGLLGESPGPAALAGACLVVLGVLVMTLGGGGGRRRADGTFWGVATGLTIAAYTLWDHHAVSALAVPPLTYFCLGLLLQAVPLTVATVAGAGRRAQVAPVLRRYWLEVLAVAVLSPLAYVLVLQALTSAPVSLVAPLRESSIVVGAVLGWWLLGEPRAARRLAGAAVVLGGIALLSLA